MPHRGKGIFQNGGTHLLGRGIRGRQLGIFGLDGPKLPGQCVIFKILEGGVIQNMVFIVAPLNQSAQLGRARGGGFFGRHFPPSFMLQMNK